MSRHSNRLGAAPRRLFNQAITGFWSFAAPIYDAPIVQQWVYRPSQDEMIALLQARHARRVADVACGTGILADRVAREVRPDAVYGVDMSEGMLAQAARRSSAVQWLTAPAEQLPFDDASLDAVISTSAFHFFNQPAALREFRRVLEPGGIAAVATFSPYQPLPLQWLSDNRLNPSHNPTPAAMRTLFNDAGFVLDDQRRVRRPAWTRLLSDLVTIGVNER